MKNKKSDLEIRNLVITRPAAIIIALAIVGGTTINFVHSRNQSKEIARLNTELSNSKQKVEELERKQFDPYMSQIVSYGDESMLFHFEYGPIDFQGKDEEVYFVKNRDDVTKVEVIDYNGDRVIYTPGEDGFMVETHEKAKVKEK